MPALPEEDIMRWHLAMLFVNGVTFGMSLAKILTKHSDSLYDLSFIGALISGILLVIFLPMTRPRPK